MVNSVYRVEKQIDKDCLFYVSGKSDAFIMSFKDGAFVEVMEIKLNNNKKYEVSSSVGCCQLDRNNLTYFKPGGIPSYCRTEVIQAIQDEVHEIDIRELEKTLIAFHNS